MGTLRTSWANGALRLLRPVASLRGGAPPPTPGGSDESGQGLAEYALMLALIAILAVGAVSFVGGSIVGTFTDPINRVFGEVLGMIS